MRSLLGRDARAVVADGDLRRGLGTVQAHRHPFLCVPRCVGEQVADRPLEQLVIHQSEELVHRVELDDGLERTVRFFRDGG